MARRQRAPRAPREAAKGRVQWRKWALAAGLLAPALFGIGYAIAMLVLFPQPPAPEGQIPVPELIGLDRGVAESEIRARKLTVGDVTALPHPYEEQGRVIAQSPLPGQQLRAGASVRFAVSSGPATIAMPDLRGEPMTEARALLERMGLTVTESAEWSDLAPGLVIRTTPIAGTEVRAPSRVEIVASQGPPPAMDSLDFPVDTLPADTLRLPR